MPKKKLNPQHQIFVSEVSKGVSQTKAYQKAFPNASYGTARSGATNLIAKPNIQEATLRRIQKAIDNSDVTLAEVVGSAARQMRYSMDDVLDENGDFDIEKARENGAIDFLKKKKTTIITDKFGNTTKTVDVEFLTNETGRKELANYLGLENLSNSAQTTPLQFKLDVFAQFYSIIIKLCSQTPLTPETALELIRTASEPLNLDIAEVEEKTREYLGESASLLGVDTLANGE